MALSVSIPGWEELRLEHLFLDVNGTLTNRGELISGVTARIPELRSKLEGHLVSADTFGTLEEVAKTLHTRAVRARSGEEKLHHLHARAAI